MVIPCWGICSRPTIVLLFTTWLLSVFLAFATGGGDPKRSLSDDEDESWARLLILPPTFGLLEVIPAKAPLLLLFCFLLHTTVCESSSIPSRSSEELWNEFENSLSEPFFYFPMTGKTIRTAETKRNRKRCKTNLIHSERVPDRVFLFSLLKGYYSASFSRISSIIFSGFGVFFGFLFFGFLSCSNGF